jgi:hypothetical protein
MFLQNASLAGIISLLNCVESTLYIALLTKLLHVQLHGLNLKWKLQEEKTNVEWLHGSIVDGLEMRHKLNLEGECIYHCPKSFESQNKRSASGGKRIKPVFEQKQSTGVNRRKTAAMDGGEKEHRFFRGNGYQTKQSEKHVREHS